METERIVRGLAAKAESRLEFWIEFVRAMGIERMAEVGVYRGEFAAGLLRACPSLQTYHMIDPWRHLHDWNKPANTTDERFEEFLGEAMAATDSFREKRIVLRGRTIEVIDEIPDGTLDLVYIDGDHTLRGIAVDLIRAYPKIRTGGFLAGDDFSPTIWQHAGRFEPTLVFPFAVYFAEAVSAPIHALPHCQFLIQKPARPSFVFHDLTGQYANRDLRSQVAARSD
jgi:Methyltransferase domain